jgi:hypothetical protein
VAVRRCWLIERTIDSVNIARPHCVGGKVPTKADAKRLFPVGTEDRTDSTR